MGLYDTVLVPPDLLDDPHEDWLDKEHVHFQTKTIGRPFMECYKIKNGKLLERNVEKEKVGEKTLEMGEETMTIPKQEIVDEWWTDCHYHGSFEFHSSWPPHVNYGDEGYEWYSYEAWFNHSELETIVKNPDR